MKSIFTFVLVSIAVLSISSCGGNKDKAEQPKDNTSGASATAPAQPKSNWSYDTTTDKMRGTSRVNARVQSTNKLNFKFPYDGGSTGGITIRKTDDKYEVLLTISKGQFETKIDGTPISVKFDDSPVEKFKADEPSDHSTNILFLDSEDKFVKEIKKAHHMIVEVDFFQEGTQQLEFDVDGLNL